MGVSLTLVQFDSMGTGTKTLTSLSPYDHQLAGFDPLPVSFTCQGRVIITLKPLRDRTGLELSPPPAFFPLTGSDASMDSRAVS